MRFYYGLVNALIIVGGFYIGCYVIWRLVVAVFGA